MNEFGKYRLFRKYASLDGVNYTPLDEYQALLVENNSCQCGYRELEYRFDGEYKEEKYKKYEIWNEYSFCPTDSSYDELTGNVDYRNPIAANGVILATYLGNGTNSVDLCKSSRFYESIAINNVEKGKKYKSYIFNNTDINEVAYSNVTNIIDGSFENCSRLTSVNIGSGVTSIVNGAFILCIRLTSVTIPSSVETIGDRVFEHCIRLNSVTMPDSVKSIGHRAFYECTSLTSINIPDSVTNISSLAFSDCKSLTSVTIPDSVTSIYTLTFDGCTRLKSVTIGSGITSIGEQSFYECTSLNSITCYATTAPTLGGSAFYNISTNGTLHVPQGSDYSSWLKQLQSGWTIEYI